MKIHLYVRVAIFVALLLFIIFNQTAHHDSLKTEKPNSVSISPQSSPEKNFSALPEHAFPDEARQTYALILDDGPFPYRQDGATFYNREKKLPNMPKNYYREYTVKTPGVDDRGARRIVCGGKKPAKPDVCYYTFDHYQTFTEFYHENASAQ